MLLLFRLNSGPIAIFLLGLVQSDGGGFIFDAHSIQKMELLVLGALQWRMRSITPFCFISFFISLFELRDPPLGQAIQARASEIILKAQNGTTERPILAFCSLSLPSKTSKTMPDKFSIFWDRYQASGVQALNNSSVSASLRLSRAIPLAICELQERHLQLFVCK